MDSLTSYYTALSTLLALLTPIFILIILYCLIFPPHYIEARFRAPKGYPKSGPRIINVLAHPAANDVAFLFIICVADIALIFPYTITGSTFEISWVWRIGGILILGLQFTAAVGWCGIQSDWLAGSRNFGLWKSASWAAYYSVFILTAFVCVGPLIFMGLDLLIKWAISRTPNVWMAIYEAYRPLIP